MKVSNTLIVKNKIFNQPQFINLLNTLYEGFDEDKESNKTLEIQVTCTDGTRYDLDPGDGNIKKNIEYILDVKRINAVNCRYYAHESNKSIFIDIKEGNTRYAKDNSISVTGNNHIWVDGKIKYYSNYLERIENQSAIIKPLVTILRIITNVLIGYIELLIIAVLINYVGYKPKSSDNFTSQLLTKLPFLIYPLLILLSYLMGSSISIFFERLNYKWLENMFPSVEFNFGYTTVSKKERFLKISLEILRNLAIPIVLTIAFRKLNL